VQCIPLLCPTEFGTQSLQATSRYIISLNFPALVFRFPNFTLTDYGTVLSINTTKYPEYVPTYLHNLTIFRSIMYLIPKFHKSSLTTLSRPANKQINSSENSTLPKAVQVTPTQGGPKHFSIYHIDATIQKTEMDITKMFRQFKKIKTKLQFLCNS